MDALSRSAVAGDVRVSATARAAIWPEPGTALDDPGLIVAPPPFPVQAYRARRAVVPAGTSRLQLDSFTVDPPWRERHNSAMPLPLEPLNFDLLLPLGPNGHSIVSRDEAFTCTWGGQIMSDMARSNQI